MTQAFLQLRLGLEILEWLPWVLLALGVGAGIAVRIMLKALFR